MPDSIKSFNDKFMTLLVSFDFIQLEIQFLVFPKVLHNGVFSKLHNSNISGTPIQTLPGFLIPREHRIALNDQSSSLEKI